MTSNETGPSWVERLNPRHWTLVWKLVIVGLVPALLALTLGVLRIADQAGSAADLGRSGRLLEARNEIVAASAALRIERDQATLYVASNGTGDRAAVDTSRQRSDQALKAMDDSFSSAKSDLEPSTQAALQRTQDSLDLIPSLRQSVTNPLSVPYDQVVNRYTNVIGAIDVLDRAILRQQRTQDTAALADASSAVRARSNSSRSSTRSSRAPSGRASRCPATPRSSTRPPHSSSPTTAITRPRSPRSSWPSSATSPTRRPPAG